MVHGEIRGFRITDPQAVTWLWPAAVLAAALSLGGPSRTGWVTSVTRWALFERFMGVVLVA